MPSSGCGSDALSRSVRCPNIEGMGSRRGASRARAVIAGDTRVRARVVMGLVALQMMAGSDASALDSRRGVTQYAQTHYETRDGMPHGLANSIAETADGYLWTGSEEGLARFDGSSFTNFDH